MPFEKRFAVVQSSCRDCRFSLITDNKRDPPFLVFESRKVHGQYDSIRVKDIGQSSRVVLVVACYDFGLIVIRSTH